MSALGRKRHAVPVYDALTCGKRRAALRTPRTRAWRSTHLERRVLARLVQAVPHLGVQQGQLPHAGQHLGGRGQGTKTQWEVARATKPPVPVRPHASV